MAEIEDDKIQEVKKEENPMIRKRWFGRGIYGSKDVPIRLLDKVIGVLAAATILLVVYSTITGGFQITFNSQGGSAVEDQKLRHGSLLAQPENPTKPGYEFAGWYYTDTDIPWNFESDKIVGDLTLDARWTAAEVLVKFDLNGGVLDGEEKAGPVSVTFGETYGELPVPVRQGYWFIGWEYSGSAITGDTKVTVNGEHILTAEWGEI